MKEQALVPLQSLFLTIWYISLNSSTGTKTPAQLEDGNFRLSTSTRTPAWWKPEGLLSRFLEPHPVTSLPTNLCKVIQPAVFLPNFAYKNSSLKAIREFASLSPSCLFILHVPCNKIFSVQTPTSQFVWPHCAPST